MVPLTTDCHDSKTSRMGATKRVDPPKERDPLVKRVGSNIRLLREKQKMDRDVLGQRVLARTSGEADPQYAYDRVSQWENGYRFPEPQTLRIIAEELGHNVEDLFKTSRQLRYEGTVEGSPIPVIPWIEVAAMTLQHKKIDVRSHVMPYELSDPEAFATRIIDESMKPVFRVGDVIVVSPGTKPQTGDYVLFILNGEPIFRIAHFYFHETKLQPLNPDFDEIVIERDDAENKLGVIGTVVQKIEKLK